MRLVTSDKISLLAKVGAIGKFGIMYTIMYDIIKAPPSHYKLRSLEEAVMYRRNAPELHETVGLRCIMRHNGDLEIVSRFRLIEGGRA